MKRTTLLWLASITLLGCIGKNPSHAPSAATALPGCLHPSSGEVQPCGQFESCLAGIGCSTICTYNEHCGAGQQCTAGWCVVEGTTETEVGAAQPDRCTTRSDCADGEYCGDNSRCRTKCQSDDHCAAGMVCLECGKCQPADTPATCGLTPTHCGPASSCGEGKQCDAGRCFFACGAEAPCPTGQICGVDQLCQDDPAPAVAECALDLECAAGRCINGYCHALCESGDECDPRSVCSAGLCRPNYHPAL